MRLRVSLCTSFQIFDDILIDRMSNRSRRWPGGGPAWVFRDHTPSGAPSVPPERSSPGVGRGGSQGVLRSGSRVGFDAL